MGRKSIDRIRKQLTPKAKIWVRDMVPLLQNQRLENLTLDDLAELVGKSKSTLYTYFSTKEEIYQTAVQLVLEEMAFLISPEAIQGEQMEEVLTQMMTKIGEGIAGISIGFLEQIQRHFPQVWRQIEDFTEKLLLNFESVYEQGMQQGAFRPYSVDLLLAMDRYFIMSIMTDSTKFSDDRMTLQRLVNEYLELRVNALKTK